MNHRKTYRESITVPGPAKAEALWEKSAAFFPHLEMEEEAKCARSQPAAEGKSFQCLLFFSPLMEDVLPDSDQTAASVLTRTPLTRQRPSAVSRFGWMWRRLVVAAK